jgi:tyrosyl-tRNA synthetase
MLKSQKIISNSMKLNLKSFPHYNILSNSQNNIFSSSNNFYPISQKHFSSHHKENIFSYLSERNLVSNISHAELLNKDTKLLSFMKDNPKLYIGFDPTAESLHLGNLIGIITAIRFAAFGIQPVFLIGGATGQIGDPSGKNKERPLLGKDKVENNLNKIEDCLKNLLEDVKSFPDLQKFCKEKSKIRQENESLMLKDKLKNSSSSSSSSGSDEDEKSVEFKLKKISEKSLFNAKQPIEAISNLTFNKNSSSLINSLSQDSQQMKNNYDNLLKTFEYAQKEKIMQSNLEENILKNISQKEHKFLDRADNLFDYKIINNFDFYKDLNIIDFLREAGSNLRMGPLLSRETVKNRLNTKEGLSLTEFMYQTFQGYDFLKLYEKYNVKIQIGGSDQWGNMLAGYELVKKMKNVEVVNMTFPLMTTASGAKFGKSEGNALFINPNLTPINNIFQYFYNLSDNDLYKMFSAFTFIENSEINDIVNFHNKEPERRHGQKLLAEKITAMLFSQEEANKCIKNTEAHYFKNVSLKDNSDEEIQNILKDCHVTELTEECFNLSVSGLCVNMKIFPTKAQCKRLIQSGSLMINNNKISEDVTINKEMFLGGRYMVLKTGKKHTHIFQINCEKEKAKSKPNLDKQVEKENISI